MKPQKPAILFPAFVPELTGKEQRVLEGFENDLADKLARASQVLRTDLTGFDLQGNNFLGDEERSQYISYIYSCTIAGTLRSRGVHPAFVSGYSMGIYAALNFAGSITFDAGLLLLQQAWRLICLDTEDGDYGMGMIVGLSEKDIHGMIGREDIWICNQNNPHTYILSGDRQEILTVLGRARDEGALRANPLAVTKPYHTKVLEMAARGLEEYLQKFIIKDPLIPIVSGLDARVLRTGDDIRRELVRNLYHSMDWLGAMNRLIGLGVDLFFECGLGDGLTRNFRFIDRRVQAFPVDKLSVFLSHKGH